MTTALPPLGSTIAARRRRRRRSVARAGGSSGAATTSTRTAAKLALDERQRSLPVHLAVTLMHVCIVARAAVWVRAVAVALDFAGGLFGVMTVSLVLFLFLTFGKRQLGCPLMDLAISYRTAIPLRPRRKALSPARADLVRDAVHVAGVAHFDHGFDLVQGGCAEGWRCLRVALVGVGASAESVVCDLRALRVADNDQLRVRATGVETVDCGGDG